MYNIEEIKKSVAAVVSHSQNIPCPLVDELMDKWAAAKKDFIAAFGHKLIFEYPEKVSFELSKETQENRIKDFITTVDEHYRNGVLASFLSSNSQSFYQNTVSIDNAVGINGEKIPKGMKLIKAFKYFENDPKTLEDLQNAASLIIQENKIEGRLCLSVHPLDYLSISENTHGWRSCHSLDGEYRAGNLSYLLDSSTIICYLKSDKDTELPNFPDSVPWNSKKWRVLLYFSNGWDMVFAGKQYPFRADNIIDFARFKLFELANLGSYSPWLDKLYEGFQQKTVKVRFAETYVPLIDGIVRLKDLVKNDKDALQFNDVLSSTSYSPIYCFNETRLFFTNKAYSATIGRTHFNIGAKCNCLRCGSEKISLTGTFMCNECELEYGECDDDIFAYCPCCGARYYEEDGVWVEGSDECVCPDCAELETAKCDYCGVRMYHSDLTYLPDYDINICECCARDKKEREIELREEL